MTIIPKSLWQRLTRSAPPSGNVNITVTIQPEAVLPLKRHEDGRLILEYAIGGGHVAKAIASRYGLDLG